MDMCQSSSLFLAKWNIPNEEIRLLLCTCLINIAIVNIWSLPKMVSSMAKYEQDVTEFKII